MASLKIIKIYHLFIIKTTIILLFCCSPNDPEPCDTLLDVKSLESEYGCENTKHLIDIALNDTFKIIRSQSSFDSLVSGTCKPQIDFTKYDLVIGKKRLISGNQAITYELVRDCKTNRFMLTVTFIQNEATVAPNITYHALVPKLKSNETIEVVLQIEN